VTANLVSLSQTSTNFLLLIVPVSETKGLAMLQKASAFFITSLRDQVFLKMRKIYKKRGSLKGVTISRAPKLGFSRASTARKKAMEKWKALNV